MTSRAAGWPSDAPTPGQMSELFAQIESGRMTKDRMQTFLRPPSAVSYSEAPSIKAGKFLESKGFVIGDWNGQDIHTLISDDQISILVNYPDVKPRRFGKRMRRPRVGWICFDLKYRYAYKTEPVDWVLEVYGREYLEQFNRLAEEMAEIFGVKILVKLCRETPLSESFLSDYSL